jgi:hypothetical protein
LKRFGTLARLVLADPLAATAQHSHPSASRACARFATNAKNVERPVSARFVSDRSWPISAETRGFVPGSYRTSFVTESHRQRELARLGGS